MYHLPGEPEEGLPTYGRSQNPTWDVVETALGHLEASPVVLFPSGMAAISAALCATLSSGNRVLIPSDGYYATRVFAEQFLSRFGVSIEMRPTVEFLLDGFDGFDVVFVETPSNPGLDLIDIAAVAKAVRASGGVTIVDNTTMTPFGQRPLDLGVDIVVASDTKAPGGHSDLLMGHAASRNDELLGRIRDWRMYSGSIPGPAEAWLLHRGLQTLEARFDRMCHSAEIIAQRLQAHKAISTLRYPGLPGDAGYTLAKAQMLRFGFLIHATFAGAKQAERFIDGCQMLQPATSFGGVHSSAERRLRWGDDVPEGAVRISIGCEPVEELWASMENALDAL